ncbi:MAG: uracil-DNA glycosylase [Thermogutta sp.]
MASGSAKDQNQLTSVDPDRLRRGLRQYCEDMQRAGIEHILWPSSVAADLPSDVLPPPAEVTMPGATISSKSSEKSVTKGKERPTQRSTDMITLLPVSGEETAPLGEVRPLPQSREEALAELAQQVARCTSCPELVNNRTQTVFGVGNPHSELVFIGEAPGVDEDRQGIPFVGRAGQLLTAMITNGMGMRRDEVYICNILRCRPPNNRTPTRDEADRCRPWLDATLAVIQPKFICCLGSVAAQNLLRTDVPIGRLRGKTWEYQQAKVVCTYHPAFLLRNPAMKREAWEDLKLLLEIMGRPIRRRSS